jgi:hypothetical protein
MLWAANVYWMHLELRSRLKDVKEIIWIQKKSNYGIFFAEFVHEARRKEKMIDMH